MFYYNIIHNFRNHFIFQTQRICNGSWLDYTEGIKIPVLATVAVLSFFINFVIYVAISLKKKNGVVPFNPNTTNLGSTLANFIFNVSSFAIAVSFFILAKYYDFLTF